MSRCYQLGHATLIRLQGKDRCRILNNVCTQDLRTLAHGQSAETFVTDVKGRTIGHGIAFGIAESIYFLTVPGQAEKLLPHLDRYVIREDVTIQSVGDSYQTWLTSDATVLTSIGQAEPEVHSGSLRAGSVRVSDLAGIWTHAPWIGTESVVMLLPNATQITNVLDQMCVEVVVSDMLQRSEWESDRIRAFWPWYGVDLDDKNLPQEIDRDPLAISFKKGCYLGQETVARLDALGQVQKKLVRLRISGEKTPAAMSKITAGENDAGWICSSAYCPTEKCCHAIGYVKRAYLGARQELQVDGLAATIL